jgi:hypothetical protein
MKTKTLSLFLSLLSLQAFAAPAQKQMSTPAPQMMQQDPNPSARFGTADRGNLYVTGEVVWFKPLQTVVNRNNTTETSQAPILTTQSEGYFRHQFTAGCRVALGYNTTFDGWDINAIYTGLNYSHNNSYQYSPAGTDADTNPGHIKMAYYFNQGDLDLGRMFKVSSKLRLRPHAGIRGLWISQNKIYNTASTSYAYYQKTKAKSYMGGLEAGLDSLWNLSKEFAIYANVAFASLVNSQKFLEWETRDSALRNYSSTNYGSSIIADVDFFIGLRWDRNFDNDNYHFGINLGYEQHNYININNQPNSFGSDFTLQGIALGARFDF